MSNIQVKAECSSWGRFAVYYALYELNSGLSVRTSPMSQKNVFCSDVHVGTKGDVRCPVCVSTFVFIQPDPCCLCVLSFSSRTEGCRIDGSICYKDSVDCSWSVALGQGGSQDGRQIWALKVGGRTGRMAVGVALDVDEVGYCYHRVNRTNQDISILQCPSTETSSMLLCDCHAGSEGTRGLDCLRVWKQSLVLHVDRSCAVRTHEHRRRVPPLS